MFFIQHSIIHIPFNFFYERMLTHFTVGLNTNGATAPDTVIRMHEKFHSRAKLFLYEVAQADNFSVRLPHIQVPGNGHVTIYMQYIAEFYYSQVMDIYPVRQPAFVQQVNYFFQYFFVCFVHNTSHRFSGDPVPDDHDDNGHNDRYNAVQLMYIRKINQHQTYDDGNRRIGIRLQVMAAGL